MKYVIICYFIQYFKHADLNKSKQSNIIRMKATCRTIY